MQVQELASTLNLAMDRIDSEQLQLRDRISVQEAQIVLLDDEKQRLGYEAYRDALLQMQRMFIPLVAFCA